MECCVFVGSDGVSVVCCYVIGRSCNLGSIYVMEGIINWKINVYR